MAKQTINNLKNLFKTGLKPSQQNFWDWLDSFWHKDEKIPLSSIDGIQAEFDKKRSTDTPIEINEVSGLEEALENAGGGSVNPIITSDIPVNLSGGRTFGKYVTGSTIPATGKTVEEVIRMAALESINPSATVVASGSIAYNATSGSLTIAMTNTINNPGATVTGFVLSYRRGAGAWVELYSGAAKASHTHDVASLLASDKTSSFSYQLVVTDSLSTSVTVTSNAITPASYSPPSVSATSESLREIGNLVYSGTKAITKNSVNTTISTWQLFVKLNNGALTAIGSATAIATTPTINVLNTGSVNGVMVTIANGYSMNLIDATDVKFYLRVVDSVTTTDLLALTIPLEYKKFYGTKTTDLTASGIRTLTMVGIGTTSHVWNANGLGNYHYVCVPVAKSLSSVVTSNNETLTSNFISGLTTIDIQDAGGNYRSYKVYKYVTAVNFSVTITAITN